MPPESALLLAAVVLLVVDVARRAILLLVQCFLVRARQLAAIGLAHSRLFAVDALLLLLELGGFSRRQLPALHALSDPILLIFLALLNRLRRVVRRCRLRENGGRRQNEERCTGQNCIN